MLVASFPWHLLAPGKLLEECLHLPAAGVQQPSLTILKTLSFLRVGGAGIDSDYV